jgi:phosphoglycerate dehydrogenase-like enzyme
MPGTVIVTARSVAGCEPALQLLRDGGCDVQVHDTPSPADEAAMAALVRPADALIVAMEPLTAGVLAAAPRLKVIARPGVGFDTVDLAAATRQGVAVTVAAGTNHESVADFTFALLLAAARGLLPCAASVAAGGWSRHTGSEVWGKTLAVVGWGRIGQAVARRARGFDLRVLAVSRSATDDALRAAGAERTTLDDALRSADFVSLHLPLTDATARLIDAPRLAAMKPGAFLVNTARGGLVDEAALADAVRRGHLGGAAVDVLCEQGARSASPLIGVPGIVVTPHMAALSREASARVAMSAAHSVLAVLRGERPPHLVNPEVFRPR